MKDLLIKFRVEKWHFYLLGLILINFGTGLITGYGLNQNLIFVLKAILYITGLILFFSTIKPLKKIAIYYSFYVISFVLMGLFFLCGGIFFAVLSTFVFYPIVPKQTEYRTETIKIYDRFQGFMASCCSYEVVEPKLFFFEKHLGYIKIEKPIDAGKDEFDFENNKIIHKYKVQNHGQTTPAKDTTEVLIFE